MAWGAARVRFSAMGALFVLELRDEFKQLDVGHPPVGRGRDHVVEVGRKTRPSERS